MQKTSTTHRNGPTTVLKVGGANLDRKPYVQLLARHVAELERSGSRVIVVHGGGAEIGALHDSLEVRFRKIDGLRVTSETSMELTTQVLCGSVNKRLVAGFLREGLSALGLSGVDLGILRASLLDSKRYGRVGRVDRVDSARLETLLDAGFLLVLAPVSLGPDGGAVNVNADTAAHAVATALGADSLDFVSDVPGVRTEAGSDEIADRLRVHEVRDLVRDTRVVRGGMLPKLQAAVAAIEKGVGRVRVGTLAGMGRGQATEILA